MTPDQLRELIEKADVIKRTTPSLGGEMGRVVRANRELDKTMRHLAPLLLELWAAVEHGTLSKEAGQDYFVIPGKFAVQTRKALTALEEA